MTFVLQRSPEFSLIPSGSSFVTPLRLIVRTSRIVPSARLLGPEAARASGAATFSRPASGARAHWFQTGDSGPNRNFLCEEKDGSQRLIIDAREANRLHKRPPHSWLGTVGAFKRLDLSDSAISDACGGALPSDLSPCGASIDLWNGFYQFRNRALGSWFGLDVPRSAAHWGATFVYNEATRCEETVGPRMLLSRASRAWPWVVMGALDVQLSVVSCRPDPREPDPSRS